MSEELNLDDRRLCPDGNCIGVLGDDDHCNVCGLADDGSSVARDGARDDDDFTDEDSVSAGASDGGTPDFEDDRRLCPDGACIGILGDDGTCKVCGARPS